MAPQVQSAEGVGKDFCRGRREASYGALDRVGHGRGEDPDPGVLSLEIPSVDCILCISELLLASPRWSLLQTVNSERVVQG